MQEWGPNTVVTHGITLGALVRHTHILPQPEERTPTKKGQRFLDLGVIIPPGVFGCYVLARLKPLVDGVIHETSFGNQTHRSLVVITGSLPAARSLLKKAKFQPSSEGETLS